MLIGPEQTKEQIGRKEEEQINATFWSKPASIKTSADMAVRKY